jgi:hypothetical protein
MSIAMSNALALMRWPDFRFLHGDFMSSGYAWLLIGVISALLVLSALVMDAALVLNASRRPWSLERRSENFLRTDDDSGD